MNGDAVDIELSPQGYLVKVTAVSDDGYGFRIFFDFRNGNTGWFDHPDPAFFAGDVLHISDADGRTNVEKVPKEAWPDYYWVGVVKIIHRDITIIESGVRLRVVPTTGEPSYGEGNTVYASDTQGVIRVLSEKPIRYLDDPTVDDEVIDRFRIDPEQSDSTLSFDDFGGLPEVVTRAQELIAAPLDHHDALAEMGCRPIKGVLFTGEPGTGKTMLARIIAAQSRAKFYEISGPEVFSKWYGQSEELLRKLFEAAQEDDKAIIFFDEIDSVAAQRDDRSHEASKRVVAQLLTLMDGFAADTTIVVIAATNRPQDLDIALRRPGRFDWEITFPYPNHDDRLDILIKTARRIKTKGSLPHTYVAQITDGWSGAELVAIWTEAALLAVADDRAAIRVEDYLGGCERVTRYRSRSGLDSPYGVR